MFYGTGVCETSDSKVHDVYFYSNSCHKFHSKKRHILVYTCKFNLGAEPIDYGLFQIVNVLDNCAHLNFYYRYKRLCLYIYFQLSNRDRH